MKMIKKRVAILRTEHTHYTGINYEEGVDLIRMFKYHFSGPDFSMWPHKSLLL